jgi:hypothetical protein
VLDKFLVAIVGKQEAKLALNPKALSICRNKSNPPSLTEVSAAEIGLHPALVEWIER